MEAGFMKQKINNELNKGSIGGNYIGENSTVNCYLWLSGNNEDFLDFEDCLQEECAAEVLADYIVTRNPEDYKISRIKVIEPSEFVKLL